MKGTNLEQKLLDYELVEPEQETAPEGSEDSAIESLTDAPMPNRPRRSSRNGTRKPAVKKPGGRKGKRK